MSMQRIREVYGVPAYRGRRVTLDGVPGVITGACRSTLHLCIRRDGETRPVYAHPTWAIDYSPEHPVGDPS